jgi:thiol peroxidase
VEKNSAEPGNRVTFKGSTKELIGTPIQVGKRLPESRVVDYETFKETDLSGFRGKVLLISVVPSIDTKVCEEQTHYLGEEGDKLPENVMRITISRDLPFAQQRFAREARLEDISYFSDYKNADFGKSTGLLVDDLMLLARSVIVVDREGIVRYIQVVPEMTHLPDMDAAFEKASGLAG